MIEARRIPVSFVVGSRKLLTIPRDLVTVATDLESLIAGRAPAIPQLPANSDGYRILSVPESALANILESHPGYIAGGRQSYRRFYIDMAGDFENYLARFSSKTRSTLRRKQRKLAEHGQQGAEICEYRKPEEIAAFLEEALPLSRRTYQARLLDAGLPESGNAKARMLELAAQDRLRAYILRINGEAAAYLHLPVIGETVVYAYLGYDDKFAGLSPGTVLQIEALERLFAEKRYRYFDFTEGEGPHKAMFGTHGLEACSFFLLRGDAGNRLLMGSLDTFDAAVATARRLAERSGGLARARRLLRA